MNVKQDCLDLRESVSKNEPDLDSKQMYSISQQIYKIEQDDGFEEFGTDTPRPNVVIKQEIIEGGEPKIEQHSVVLHKIGNDSISEKNVQCCPTTIKKELYHTTEMKDIKEEFDEYVQTKVELLTTHCDLPTLKNENISENYEYSDCLTDSWEEHESISNRLKNKSNVLNTKRRKKPNLKYINGHFQQDHVAYKLNEKLVKKNGLQEDLKIHTNEKSFECDICSKKFKDKRYLQSHLIIHTNKKPFICNICSKKFNHKSTLQTHLRTHSNERSFKCNVCSKKFNEKSTLQTHLRIHSNEKTFKCDICSKRFNFKSNLQEHSRIHTNEKPFKCNICFKEFSQKGTLQNHLIMHSNEKPFKCDICSKEFIKKCSLQAHLRTHYNEKPFKCDICSKTFNYKCNLQTHLKNVHQ